MNRFLRRITLCIIALSTVFGANALSFDLDSIAAWGKFPRFCINTYRWGDKFFNTYDSAYVVGSGYKFNVKIVADSFLDNYNFDLPNSTRVDMVSDPSTSIGFYLTYLAVSVGYDINLSNVFKGTSQARSRYRAGFDCSLLSFEAYIENNKTGTKIKRFGIDKDLDMPFNDISIKSWGIDAYYFFNHKRYSKAAAYNFSKIQHKSQGSFYAGLSFFSQNYDFDFNSLPLDMTAQLPVYWTDRHYRVKTRNYGLRLGYGYNWAFAPRWLFAVNASPTVGFRRGLVNSEIEKTDFAFYMRFAASVVWNKGHLFAGVIGKIDSALINDRKTVFMDTNMNVTASVGYRFNLW